MKIEVLYWEGCPSLDETRAVLDGVLAELRIEQPVEFREIESPEQAEAERFPGSPTVRVDGRDVDPAGAETQPALTCRIYHRPDGRVSPVPSRDQLKEALT